MATEAIASDLRTALPRAVGGAGRRAGTALRLILRTTSGRIALPIVLLHVTMALIGPWLAPFSPTEFQYSETGEIQQFLAPSFQFLLGTDQFGRDILSRVMAGATSLIVVAGSGTILTQPYPITTQYKTNQN